MKIEVVVICVFIVIYAIYLIYFKPYRKMRKVFQTLTKFIDARDSLVLKLVPEMKDKKISHEVIKAIEERKLNFSSGQNNAILSDIKLNAILKTFYEKYNQVKKNELEKDIFSGVLKAEQNLKHLRTEYNLAVEEYNHHIVRHKFFCIHLVKMKPLDTYGKQ